MGGSFDAGDVDLLDGAAGALVQALEDEYEEVRSTAIQTIETLSLTDREFAASAIDFLVDMLNDELASVRLLTAKTLARLSGGSVELPEDQLRLLTCGLEDRSPEMRFAVTQYLSCFRCSHISALSEVVNSFLSAVEANPAELSWIGLALKKIAENHALILESLVDDLFPKDLKAEELTMDSPRYAAKLILLLSASGARPSMVPLLPQHCERNRALCEGRFPGCVPGLRARGHGLSAVQLERRSRKRGMLGEPEGEQARAKPTNLRTGVAAEVVGAAADFLCYLRSLPPPKRASGLAWERLVSIDKALASVSSGKEGACAEACAARILVQFAAHLALAQARVGDVWETRHGESPASNGARRSAAFEVIGGLNAVRPLSASAKESFLDPNDMVRLAMALDAAFWSEGDKHRSLAETCRKIAGTTCSLFLSSDESTAGATGQRLPVEVVSLKEPRVSEGFPALREALCSSWIPDPRSLIGVGLCLTWGRVENASMPRQGFRVKHSPGLPLRLDLKVTLKPPAQPGDLSLAVNATAQQICVIPLKSVLVQREATTGELKAEAWRVSLEVPTLQLCASARPQPLQLNLATCCCHPNRNKFVVIGESCFLKAEAMPAEDPLPQQMPSSARRT